MCVTALSPSGVCSLATRIQSSSLLTSQPAVWQRYSSGHESAESGANQASRQVTTTRLPTSMRAPITHQPPPPWKCSMSAMMMEPNAMIDAVGSA